MLKKAFLPLLSLLLVSGIGCSSVKIVPLATITSKDKSVDIAIDLKKKSRDEFITVTEAELSADDNSLILYSYTLGDGGFMSGYVPKVRKYTFRVDSSTLSMEILGQDRLVELKKRQAAALQKKDERYDVQMRYHAGSSGIRMVVTDKKTGRSIVLEGFASPYFSRHGTMVAQLKKFGMSGLTLKAEQNLVFIKMPEMMMAAQYPLPPALREDSGGFSLFPQGMGGYRLNTLLQGMGAGQTDKRGNIYLNCASIMVRFFDLKTCKLLGQFILLDGKNWMVVTPDGRYDGTDEALRMLFWQTGEEQVPLKNFDASFHKKGLLADILRGRADKETDTVKVDIAGQLIGKVREIKGREIIVSTGKSAGKINMGDKLFVVIDGKKVTLEAVFPMMTITRCVLRGHGDKYTGRITRGTPVFR